MVVPALPAEKTEPGRINTWCRRETWANSDADPSGRCTHRDAPPEGFHRHSGSFRLRSAAKKSQRSDSSRRPVLLQLVCSFEERKSSMSWCLSPRFFLIDKSDVYPRRNCLWSPSRIPLRSRNRKK